MPHDALSPSHAVDHSALWVLGACHHGEVGRLKCFLSILGNVTTVLDSCIYYGRHHRLVFRVILWNNLRHSTYKISRAVTYRYLDMAI
jgi:hypothetical protein